jgi:hypothetical protein
MQEQLTSGPLVNWIVMAHDSAEYPMIREFRHGFTHRQVSRHVKVFLGEDRSEFESEVGGSRQTAAAHLRTAVPFAVERFSASATQPSSSSSTEPRSRQTIPSSR